MKPRASSLVLATACVAVLMAHVGQAQSSFPQFTACIKGVSGSPGAMVVDDFNHDGNPDFAIVDRNGTEIFVLLTDRTHFAAGDCLGGTTVVPVAVAAPAVAIAAGDVDANGTEDIVVAVQSGVSVLHGDGKGTFTVDAPIAAGAGPQAVAVADVDGDGLPDIVVGNGAGNSVTILYGRVPSTENPAKFEAISIAVGEPISSIIVQDLNKDSFVDIAAISRQTGNVSVFLQDPTSPGMFPATPRRFNAGVAPSAAVVGDFNGDGTPDLAVTAGGVTAGVLEIFTSNLPADPPYVLSSTIMAGMNPTGVAVGDLDGNGDLDAVVVSHDDEMVHFFIGDGMGGVHTVPELPEVTANGGPEDVVLANVDGDGRDDVLISDEAGGKVTFLLSAQIGTRTPTPVVSRTATLTRTSTVTGTPTVTPTLGGDCCQAHSGPGCGNGVNDPCASCVCSLLPACCNGGEWDARCVDLAKGLEGSGCDSSCLCNVPTATPETPTATVPPTETPVPTNTPTGSPPTATTTATATLFPTRTATITVTATRTPTITETPGPQCIGAVCVQGKSCAIATASDTPGYEMLVLPAMLWLQRRVYRKSVRAPTGSGEQK